MKVKGLLNILSIMGSFFIIFGLLFLIQEYTIGQIAVLKNLHVFNIILFKDLLFTASSLLFILKFVDFYLPNRGDS